jgi:hypothetical protein
VFAHDFDDPAYRLPKLGRLLDNFRNDNLPLLGFSCAALLDQDSLRDILLSGTT